MAQRKTIRSLDLPILIPVFASLATVVAIGVLVHGIMWAKVSADDAERAPVEKPATIKRHAISSGSLAA